MAYKDSLRPVLLFIIELNYYVGMESIKMPDAPDLYEQVARMKYIHGKTWADISRALSISRKSTENIARKIRRDMGKALRIMAIMRE